MKRLEYYPKRQSDQPEWLINFARRLLEHGADLGLATDAMNGGVADALYLAYVYGTWLPAVREFGPGCTLAVEALATGTGTDPAALPTFIVPGLPPANAPLPATVAVLPGALDRIFRLVQEIKAKPAYTAEIGSLMGIIGSEGTQTPGPATGPEFSLKVEQGDTAQVVRVKFKKSGHMGVAIYSRRAGGDWVLLGIGTSSPYLDDRPLANSAQPETREYRLRFWDNGSENGAWSSVAKATVAP